MGEMLIVSTGSERARNAKTAGATLAEAGKINESLMYLGQCLQMQSDQSHDLNKVRLRCSLNSCGHTDFSAAYTGSIPTVQTYRITVLQLLPQPPSKLPTVTSSSAS